ncbi:MAG: tetratricopeptide repeat protein [Candidatus Obscuribacterales bacterium]|nr:tetratricopeptide repeat protein [Candidatus Obscuribacterales bacterium]
MNRQKVDGIASYLTTALNAVVLVYLVIFSCAQPSPQLIGATTFEAIFLLVLLTYRWWKAGNNQAKEATEALAFIESKSHALARLRTLSACASVTVAIVVLLFAAIDLTALISANFGQLQVAQPLYLLTAPPAWTSLQPAFTLEVLAGACIESHNFDKAERLELANLAIRKALVGENHELVASSYCDLGDLYNRCNRPIDAENYYRKSINLATKIGYAKGFGKPMTSLACLLRDQKRYEESEQAFRKALAIRQRLFGRQSEKVGETLLGYSQLLQVEGKPAEAKTMQSQANSIRTFLTNKNRTDTLTPIVVSCVFIVSCSQKDRLLILLARRAKKVL